MLVNLPVGFYSICLFLLYLLCQLRSYYSCVVGTNILTPTKSPSVLNIFCASTTEESSAKIWYQ